MAARVACNSSVPKTWIAGIFFVGVLPSGAGTVSLAPRKPGPRVRGAEER